MIANAQVLEQQIEIARSRPADSRVTLEAYRQALSQGWTACFSVASPVRVPTGAFEAARHNATLAGPINLSLTEPEEGFRVLRPAGYQGEAFRGKRGKLTVIRK